ncbi:MAG: iron chelate uptake ABC transporter family permease subunit [Turicibacter sp.]|nr:iron chelate uptake ABC transporter family permease subunit [Turicibacter sp.]
MDKKIKFILLGAAAFAAIILAVGIGTVSIPPTHILAILGNRLFGFSLPDSVSANWVPIVFNIRLPRVLLAFIVGAAMSVAGTLMQSLLQNPLASPFTIGVSAGASLGAAVFIVFSLSIPFLGIFGLPLMGFLSGLATVLLILGLTLRLDRHMGNHTLLLVGMVVSLFINALITLLIATSRQFMEQLILWQLGSFAGRGWNAVGIMLGISLIGTGLSLCLFKELDMLAFGEEQAAFMGVNIKRVKPLLLTLSAFLAGGAVSFVGIIGFVDLISPHLARRIFGASHRVAIPGAASLGGTLMVIADLVGRTLISPQEIPVGAITALIGAPFFIYIYGKKGPAGQNRSPLDPLPALKTSHGETANQIDIQNLSAGYGETPVIQNLNLKINKNLAILGPNGCGKTTLLKAIAGMLPFNGNISLDGTDLSMFRRRELAGQIAMLPQIRHIQFPYTVWEAVRMGRYRCQKSSLFSSSPTKEDCQVIEGLLEALGLSPYQESQLDQLSGGQLQRVFLAQALAQDPKIILLDEPTNHLDMKYQLELIDYLKNWAATHNRLVIGVFHDINLALRLTSQTLFLKDGKIAGLGDAKSVITKDFLKEVYGIDMASYMKDSLAIWEHFG